MSSQGRRIARMLVVASVALISLTTWANSVADVAIGIGTTPEAMVVAGLSTAQGSAVLSRCAEATAERAALEQSTEACRAASVVLVEARTAAILNPHSAAHQQAFLNATDAFATARIALEQAEFDLVEAMIVDLDSAAAQRLRSVSRRLQWKVPPCFIALEGDDSWWKRIEGALRSEERAIRTEDEMDPDQVAILTSVRSHPDVQLAQQRLDAGLQAMRGLFEQP